MGQHQHSLDDQTLLTQFEQKTLDPVYFNHLGHLRLAYLYLRHHDLDTALNLVCTGIKAYAESLGANDKFHLTMTNAAVLIVSKRLEKMTNQDWLSFQTQNADLFNDLPSIIGQHYSEDLLFSEEARRSLLSPDLTEI